MEDIIVSIVIISVLVIVLILILIKSLSLTNDAFNKSEHPDVKELTKLIGEEAEYAIDLILKAVKREIGGEIYKNVILKSAEGYCCEIDHIYVSRYGVYIIETKSWSGRVIGKKDCDVWKEINGYRNPVVHYRKNPLIQNHGHLITFKKVFNNLGYGVIKPIVVFMSGKLDLLECKDVVLSDDLFSFIISDCNEMLIDEANYKGVVKKLNSFVNNPIMTHDEYVEYIRSRHKEFNKS